MTFAYPWFLVLLLLLPLFYRIKRFSKLEQVFSREVLLKLQIGTLGRFKLHILALSFALIVIALARPVVLSQDKQEVAIDSFNLVVALDISKSMKAEDIFPNRLEFAKKAIGSIMDRVPKANIAVIAYADDAFLVSPFSSDFQSIKFLLSNLDSGSLVSRGSQTLSALRATDKVFESTVDERRVLLLVTDGADGRDLEEIQKHLKQSNITLHVLSIGTKKGISLSDGSSGLIKDRDGHIVVSRRDDSLMSVLDEGAFLSSSGELSEIGWLVDEIKDSVEIKGIGVDRYEGAKEFFYYPLAFSLVLIFFAFNYIKMPFLMVMFLVPIESYAGLFDFIEIHQAKKSYERGEYKEAMEGFAKLDTQSAKYNRANTLYRQGKFEEALSLFKSIEGFSGDLEHKRAHNIGNTYAKLGKLEEAIVSYEKALEIKEDEDTRANLELMKRKKEQEQKKEQEGEKDKDKSDEQSDEQKSEKESEKSDEQEVDKQKSKESEAQPKEKQKNISEAEARKWENRMNNKEFKTRPMKLKKGERNEIFW